METKAAIKARGPASNNKFKILAQSTNKKTNDLYHSVYIVKS